MTEYADLLCVICTRRYRDEGSYTCSAEPSALRALLTELPELYALLTPLDDRQDAMSAGPVRAVQTGPRTSGGSVEAAVPIDLTVLDLTAPSRMAARQLAARGALGLDPDQVGDLSVPTVLETWCRDWRDTLYPGSPLPGATVVEMCRWLADRVPAACERHPAIDEAAAELRQLRARIRGVAGYSDRPELVPGRCPRCRWKALHRLPGDGWIRCGNEEACGTLWAPEELCVTAA